MRLLWSSSEPTPSSNISNISLTLYALPSLERKNATIRGSLKFEQGTFTPLTFDTNGALGTECSTYHQILAKKAQKSNKNIARLCHPTAIKYLLILVRSTLFCLGGSHTHFYQPPRTVQ